MEEIDLKRVSELLEEKIILIGENIRRHRIKAGVTQQTLAFYILTDKCMISNIETGRCTNINIHMLTKLAEAFGVTVDDLFKT